MVRLTILALFTSLTLVAAGPLYPRQANGGPPFDPSGAKNVGNGAGGQFIGGQCLSAADCGSGCCAGPSGICSGVGAQTQAGKTGCGFVSGSAPAAAPPAASSPAAAAAPPAAAGTASAGGPPFDPAGVKNVGNGKGTQFIGGQCLSAADCESGCCAGPSGICSGVGAQLQAGKTGCGFVSGSSAAPAAAAPAAAAPAAAAPPAAAAAAPPLPSANASADVASVETAAAAAAAAAPPAAATPAAVSSVSGKPPGTQFISGPCGSDADCASGCCGKTQTCNARAVAEGPDGGGCGH